MTPIDYIAKCQRYRRYQIFAGVAYTVAIATAVGMSMWLDRTGCSSGLCLLLVILVASLIGSIMFYSVMRGPRKRAKALELLCPVCAEPMVGRSGEPAIVRDRCARCGTQVLEEG